MNKYRQKYRVRNKLKIIILETFFLVVFLASLCFAEVKILPLGDSVTANVKTKSYRYYLWHLLKNEGCNIDFVGSVKNQIYTDFDPDHEGHSGWKADQIAERLSGMLAKYSAPDIVLLHIGHNDFFQGESVASTLSEIESIIKKLQARNPKVTVFLAQIIIPGWVKKPGNKYVDLNSKLPDLAMKNTTAKSLVIPVDHATGFDGKADTFDGAHPNEAGNEKIAKKWFDAIVPLLPSNSCLNLKRLAPQRLRIITDKR